MAEYNIYGCRVNNMRLSRIFVEQALQEGVQIQLDTNSAHYVKNVLRLKTGASIALFNGQDFYDFKSLLSYEGKRVMAAIQNRTGRNTESILHTEIIQGLSRNDHMDWTIQKCTELGVTRISVFNGNHSQIPLKAAQQEKRLLHWRNIAIKACEQCGRHIPPQIDFQPTLYEVLNAESSRALKILLSFEGESLRSDIADKNSVDGVTVLLGPEGGLSQAEIESAQDAGYLARRLGPRVLRTETAAATALAILQYIHGDI